MDRAIGDYIRGRPPGNPAVLAMTFSKIDPQMAPKGKHTLYTWAQWHPYQLAGGLNWEDIREKEADKIWSVVERYAPNMKRSEEHTSELQSRGHLVCRLLLE